ncbi:MAG: hypothetical protein HQ521_03575 [Bacteroidetes bacterium]|nr:hypothetical protein [Bacteroidota bacterium]
MVGFIIPCIAPSAGILLLDDVTNAQSQSVEEESKFSITVPIFTGLKR